MLKILIYGDSNVWGDNFDTKKRIVDSMQWPNLLQAMLGSKYKIIQEGLPGRLAGNDEKEKLYKNGQSTFECIFRTSSPVDIVIIALGTNDLQLKYHKSIQQITDDLVWYEKKIYELYDDMDIRKKYFCENMPRIIYLLPPKFELKDNFFDEDSEKKRKELFNRLKKEITSDIVLLDDLPLVSDGVHLSEEGHKLLSLIIYRELTRNDILTNLKDIFLNNQDKRICVLGTSCVGKTTLIRKLNIGIDMDEAIFPLLSKEEKDYVCQTPWTKDVGLVMNNLVRERLTIKPGYPMFGTVLLDCDLIIYLHISDDLLKERAHLRGVDYRNCVNMQQNIEEELKHTKIRIKRLDIV